MFYDELKKYKNIKITTSLISELQDIFPDINISKSYKNCCDYYQIKW